MSALIHCPPGTPFPPPPAGNRPSPSPLAPRRGPCSRVPASVRAPGGESPGGGRERGCGWAAAPAPARGSVATGAALAAIFCSCRGRGSAERGRGCGRQTEAAGTERRGVTGRVGGVPSLAGAGWGARSVACSPAPPPAAVQAERGAPRGERLRSHPFPAILYPGWRLPKAEMPQTKPAPGLRGPLQHTLPEWPGAPVASPSPRPSQGARAPPHTHGGGSARDGHSPSSRGSTGTSVPRGLLGWTRALAAAHPGCGKGGVHRRRGDDEGWALF